MLKKIMCSALILAGAAPSFAADFLTADQVNVLMIQRRQLIERRREAATEFVLNEKKIEMLLAWAKGENPSTIKNKIVPAAASSAGGVALTVYIRKNLPKIVASLPPNVQKIVKYAPALAGTITAAYVAWDTKEYDELLKEMMKVLDVVLAEEKANPNQSVALAGAPIVSATGSNILPSMPTPPASAAQTAVKKSDYADPNGPRQGVTNKKMDDYYLQLLVQREALNEEILLVTLQVNRLNAKLHIYE